MNTRPDLIEDALRTYPLAEPPAGFSARVVREVRASQAPPRFRLTWMDYALGLLLTILPASLLLVWSWLPRQFFLRLQFEWLLFQQPRVEGVVLISLAVAAGLLLLGMLAVARFIFEPRIRLV